MTLRRPTRYVSSRKNEKALPAPPDCLSPTVSSALTTMLSFSSDAIFTTSIALVVMSTVFVLVHRKRAAAPPRFISNVNLLVTDYDVAIDFFVNVLKFDLTEHVTISATKRRVVVRPPGAQTGIVLALADKDAQKAAVGNQFGGRVGFFIFTNDFATEHARMVAANVVFDESPRHEKHGTVVIFRDPWNNKWEMVQPAGA